MGSSGVGWEHGRERVVAHLTISSHASRIIPFLAFPVKEAGQGEEVMVVWGKLKYC